MPLPKMVATATEISRNFSSVTCSRNNYSYAQKTSKTLKHWICEQLSFYLKKVIQLMEPSVLVFVAQSCSTLFDPSTVDHQAPLSMEFMQQHWSGLPFPSLGDLPDPGIEPRSPALQTDSLLTVLQGKSVILIYESKTKKGQLIILNFFIMWG